MLGLQLLLLALAPGSSPPASAGEAEAVLQWTAPPGCPTQDQVRAEVERLLGSRVRVDESPLRFQGEITPTDGAYRLVLGTVDGSWQRSLDAESCAELGSAAALFVASAIDPLAALSLETIEQQTAPSSPENANDPAAAAQDTDTPAEPEPAEPPAPKPPPPEDPDRSPRAAPPNRLTAMGLGVGPGGGLLPGVYGEIELDGAWGGRVLHGELGLRTQLPARKPTGPGAIQLWGLQVRPGLCARWSARRLAVPACVSTPVGFVRGEGEGLPAIGTSTLPSVRAELRLALEIRLAGDVWLAVGGNAGASLVRPGFEVDGLGEVHRASAIVGGGLVGVRYVRRYRAGQGTGQPGVARK